MAAKRRIYTVASVDDMTVSRTVDLDGEPAEVRQSARRVQLIPENDPANNSTVAILFGAGDDTPEAGARVELVLRLVRD